MVDLADELAQYAQVDGHVLLLGETGAGKEMLADAIHRLSLRWRGPYCVVNCAHLTDELFVSTMFGHERGSFTGANERQIGEVEAAHGGTLFLDEISELKSSAQAQLLRFLETKTFKRLGSTRELSTDVKIVVASNVDLEERVQQGKFRDDLFRRLNILTCVVPSLRDRLDDILPIVRFSSLRFLRDLGRHPHLVFSAEVIEELMSHTWPGNVRELVAVLYRTFLLSQGGLIGKVVWSKRLNKNISLPVVPSSQQSLNIHLAIKQLKRSFMEEALRRTNGDISKASRMLGVERKTFYRMRYSQDTLTQN